MQKNQPRLNPALKEFFSTPSRFKVLYGGRASGKSTMAAAVLIFMAQKCKIKVLCARAFQTNIRDSVYVLLVDWINKLGLQDSFVVTDSTIKCPATGSSFVFYGVNRNLSEIKGLEGISICWLEEAAFITKEQFEVILPTIRTENSECWIIFNPNLPTDFVYQNFVVNPPSTALVKKINYDDNIFLSKTLLTEIEELKARSYSDYEHLYLGFPRADEESCIIKLSHLMSSIDAHKKLGITISGAKTLGYDPADGGGDSNAIAISHGGLLYHTEEWTAKENHLLTSARKALHIAGEHEAQIVYDSIGVGAGLYQAFSEAGSKTHRKFVASGKIHKPDSKFEMSGVKNGDLFGNIRAQAWFMLAAKFAYTHAVITGLTPIPNDLSKMAFLSSSMPNLDKLITELSTPRRVDDSSGKILVESKKDLKKRGINSPNLADAAVMSLVRFSSGLFS
ncbi:MAG: PBSX family phage terminase large subunit [Rickettsiales bacterium]